MQNDELDMQFQKALSLQKSGNLEESENILRSLIKQYPDKTSLYGTLALILTLNGKVAEALINYTGIP